MGCGASSDKYRPGIEVELAPELGLSGREADTVKKQLARQALLAELPKNKLVHVVSGLMSLPWKVKDGTALAEQGESPAPDVNIGYEVDGMWLLVEGCVEAVKTYASEKQPPYEQTVWEYRVGKDKEIGDWFGEDVLVGETSRSATFRAKGGVAKVLHIRRSAWEELKAPKLERLLRQQRVRFMEQEYRQLLAAKREDVAVKIGNAAYSMCDKYQLDPPVLEPIKGLKRPRFRSRRASIETGGTLMAVTAAVKMKGKAARVRRASVDNTAVRAGAGAAEAAAAGGGGGGGGGGKGLARTTTAELLQASEKQAAASSPKSSPGVRRERRRSVTLSQEEVFGLSEQELAKKKKQARSSERRRSVTAIDFKRAKEAAAAAAPGAGAG
jgi:CRP-like cAMP-binding protein